MCYSSNRAAAIALSTMLLALLLASSFASIPTVHGQIGATVSPKDYPIFCDSTGSLTFTFNTGGAAWYGVAIELPKEFLGLADGEASKVDARDITLDPRFIVVYDEELYYPYNREYYWVEICANSIDHPNWTPITGAKTVTLLDITAPTVARDYPINLYYTTTNFICTYNLPTDFSDGNRGNLLSTETVKVHMREEGSTISGTISDTTVSPPVTLNAGYVTATFLGGPLYGKIAAKTKIASDGSYSLTGLYEGAYKLTAWGKKTAVAGYIPTELASSVTVGRRATLTGVNIAVTKGGEISGNVRLYDGTTPVTPSQVLVGFTLPGAGLPLRLELVDSAGRVVMDTTVNVPAGANNAAYSIKELYKDTGISTGTYNLKAYAFGFVQTAPVPASVTAGSGITIDVPLVKGGGISGTLNYFTSQGTAYTLTSDTTVLVEAYDSAGALKGVWIGTALTGQTSTAFLIRGTGESITPSAGAGFTTVALKTYSGRKVKDIGLTDGGYTIKVSVAGFIQSTPYPTAVVSSAGTGSVTIYIKRGGQISGTIYAKDPTGVYNENWQRVTPPTWEYDATVTKTRIRAYIYNAGGLEMGYATGVYQDSGSQTAIFSFNGFQYSTSYLQTGYKQTALVDGTYTVKVYTWGYWQPTPYPSATIQSAGTQTVDCTMRRSGVVAGAITFKEAGITISGGITALARIEVKDASNIIRGVAFYTLTSATQLTYSVYGLYKFGARLSDYGMDNGVVDGAYYVVLTLADCTHPTQTGTVVGGGSSTLNFDAYRMGTVTGTVRGAVTDQATPAPLSWVKITLAASPVVYAAYSADGSYSIRVPDGTYTMAFSVFGYKSHTTTVTISSGAAQVISADLAETFEPISEFPLGAVFTLATSLGLALYLMRWTRLGK